MHERRAFTKRLAAQHLELSFVGDEAEDGTERRGLAGAVRADEADDAAGLHGEIGTVQRDMRAVLFGEI